MVQSEIIIINDMAADMNAWNRCISNNHKVTT